jgi:hypothetical protein
VLGTICAGISILASQLSVVYSNHLDCDEVLGSASPGTLRPAMKSGRYPFRTGVDVQRVRVLAWFADTPPSLTLRHRFAGLVAA